MKKILALSMLLTIMFVPAQAFAKVWNYTEITTGTPKENRHPSRSGDDIVWVGYDERGKYSVMHHDLSTGLTRSITTDVITGHYGMATVNNGLVAIRSYDRDAHHNYYVYDIKTQEMELIYTSPIGTFPPYWGYMPSYHSIDPMIHNGEVVFSAWDGNDYEIMHWKNGVVTQITDNDADDYEPQIWNGQISWTGWGGSGTAEDVYYFDGQKIHQITSRRGKDEDTFIADGKIMWTGQSYEIGDGTFNIYSYDIATAETKLEYQSAGQNYEPAIYQNTFALSTQKYDLEKKDYTYSTWYSDGYKSDELRYGDADADMIGPFIYKDSVLFSAHDGNTYQVVMASYKTGGYNPNNYEGAFRGLTTVGNYAYAAQDGLGIGVYDLSDPGKPVKIDRVNTDGTVFDLAEHNGKLFAAAREGGVEVYDISTPGNISRFGTIAIDGVATKLLLHEDQLFVGAREGGLSVIDLTENSMGVIGHVTLPGLTMGLDILNNIGYVAGYHTGMHIVDLSDPTNLTLIGTLGNIGKVWDVNIHQNTAFLSIAGYGLLAYDLSSPLDPVQIGNLQMPNGDQEIGWLATFEMTIREHIAFVSAGTQGIFAVDISDPANMRIIERYETPEFAWTSSIFDKYLLGSDYTGGFNLYDVTDHLPDIGKATPVPAPVLLLGSGLIGIAALRRKKYFA